MSFKCLTVFLLAAYFIQPNDALFGIDTTIQDIFNSMESEVTIAQNDLIIMRSYLAQLSEAELTTSVTSTLNQLISANVMKVSGSQAKIPDCISQYQVNFTDVVSTTTTTFYNCVGPIRENFTQAVAIMEKEESKITFLLEVAKVTCLLGRAGGLAACPSAIIDVLSGKWINSPIGSSANTSEAYQLVSDTGASMTICQSAAYNGLKTESIIPQIVSCTLL